jgi:hypothetical protein
VLVWWIVDVPAVVIAGVVGGAFAPVAWVRAGHAWAWRRGGLPVRRGRDAVQGGRGGLQAPVLLDERLQLAQPVGDLLVLLVKEVGHGHVPAAGEPANRRASSLLSRACSQADSRNASSMVRALAAESRSSSPVLLTGISIPSG